MRIIRYVVLPVALTVLSVPVWAQGRHSDSLFDQYAGTKNYTYVNIGSGLVHFAGLLSEEIASLDMIENVKLLHAKDTTAGRELTGAVNALLKGGEYQDMGQVVESGETTTIYGLKGGDTFSELLLINHAEQSSVISVRGMFDKESLSDFRELTRCAQH